MPGRRLKIVKANTESIILEGPVGTDYRINIPKAIQHHIKPEEVVQITIKKVREVRSF